jgi:hypothetical protein
MKFSANAIGGRARDEFLAAAQAEGVALDAGFRGFVLRTSRRCRLTGDLAESRRAGADCVVLHHPVLLESNEVVDQVADAIAKVARAWAYSTNPAEVKAIEPGHFDPGDE